MEIAICDDNEEISSSKSMNCTFYLQKKILINCRIGFLNYQTEKA